MIRPATLFLVLTLPLTAAKAPPTLPGVPDWDEEDFKALAGGTLVPGASLLVPEEGDQADAVNGELDPPSAEDLARTEERWDEVPEAFLDAYFANPPSTFLIDPQGLLDSRVSRERSEFLDYHSGDSEIALYVYVFGGDQEIPAGVRHEELPEWVLSTGKPAVAVLYHLGAPQRSVIRLSPSLMDSITAAEQRAALANAVSEALGKSDPVGQLEAFCVRMSIRLYWMERAAGLASEPPLAGPDTTETPAEKEKLPAKEEFRKRVAAWAKRWLAPGGVVAGTLVVSALGIWFARAKRKFRFPEFEVSPRLGGDHGAGVGAVLSFGSTSQSPSSQRADGSDYLAGI